MISQLSIIFALPLLAASASCPAPPPPPKPSCGSIHPKWTLEPINLSSYYTYVSPSAAGPKLGSISFAFKNDQVDYISECKGSSVNPRGQFYGSASFDCVTPGGEAWKKTSFNFDQSSGEIKIVSRWTCGGDVVYQTNATGEVQFNCNTETWTNPDWKSGELFSNTTTTCDPTSLVLQL